jgi:hypothetical protein
MNASHYFYFESHALAAAAAGELERLGLSVTVRRAADGDQWLVLASAPHAGPSADDDTIWSELAARYEGEYDGVEIELPP